MGKSYYLNEDGEMTFKKWKQKPKQHRSLIAGRVETALDRQHIARERKLRARELRESQFDE